MHKLKDLQFFYALNGVGLERVLEIHQHWPHCLWASEKGALNLNLGFVLSRPAGFVNFSGQNKA